ncbi:MAG: Na+/H+ antiporter subunit E [Rhodospirillales bacterium]|nr:Na+/H+ antiporter subunit E [Rhodospirillales bacterium]
MSGILTPLLIGLGVASCILVLIITIRMDIVDHESAPIHLTWRSILYMPWLAWEIVKANIDVARVVLHPRLPISPTLIHVKPTQKSDLALVFFANSITLTPGTISVDVGHGDILVHAITRDAAAGLENGEMDRRVTQVAGEDN